MRKLFTICILSALLPCAAYAQGQRTFTVAGSSMEPALMPGDNVVVENNSDGIKRGELVAIGFKGRPGLMVKRVAAAAGDTVEIKGGELYVNGEPHSPKSSIDPGRWGPALKQLERYGWTVPEGMLFVLGDNPANSRDSRRLGLISIDQIKGRATKVNGHTPKGTGK